MARTALTAGVVDTLLEEGGGELRLLFFRDLVFDLSIGVYPHERHRLRSELELTASARRPSLNSTAQANGGAAGLFSAGDVFA